MGKLISIIGAWITKKALWGVALKSLAVIYWSSITAMVVSFFYMLNFFISKIREIISFTTTYSGGNDLLSKMFAAFNLSGFSQALNDTSGIFSAAVVFLLSRILIVNVNRFYRYYYKLLESQTKSII